MKIWAVDVTVIGHGDTMEEGVRNAWSKVQDAGVEVDNTYVDGYTELLEDTDVANPEDLLDDQDNDFGDCGSDEAVQ